MKKIKLILLAIISVSSLCKAQVIGTDTGEKKYKAWKQSKLYVVKTTDEEINTELEKAVRESFPNFTSSVTEAEADKLMDNENNFFATIYYPGSMKTKQNAWDKFAFGIGIFQGKEKKLQKINIYNDALIRQSYLPIAPNLNTTLMNPASRLLYTKTGADKTFKPEPTIKIMIAVIFKQFKQSLDALDKTEGVTTRMPMHKAVAKILSEDAKILKNKTLLIIDNEMTTDFYNGYAFKKEKIQASDLSKLSSKDKNYCFLTYSIEEIEEKFDQMPLIKQLTVIDCETGKIIYQDASVPRNNSEKIIKKLAENLNNSINGKAVE